MGQRKAMEKGAVSLVALLAACTLPLSQGKERKIIHEGKGYAWYVGPFAMYNPKTTTEFIAPDERIMPYIVHGLDADQEVVHREKYIQGYARLQTLIQQEAASLGYGLDHLQTCSPREAAEIACRIIAARVNYFGRTSDFESKVRRKKERERWKTILKTIEKSDYAEESEKINAKQRLDTLTLWDKTKEELEKLEDSLAGVGNIATYYGDYDIFPTEQLLREKRGVVCRQFANMATDIFFVLKQGNRRLQNTYVTEYSARNHRWNQISALCREEEKIIVSVSFFDPTSYDSCGDMEGYDRFHFVDFLPLKSQLENVKKKTNKE